MRRVRRAITVLAATAGVAAGGSLLSAAAALAAAPEAMSESVSAVTSSEGHLEATVNAGEESTECHFQYGKAKAAVSEREASCEQAPLTGGEQGVAAGVMGLEAGEIYYYRVVVKNTTGSSDGRVQTFTTVPEPFTDVPMVLSGTGARFEGHFTLDPVDTKYSFEYNKGSSGCTGESSTPTVDAGAGTSVVSEAWEVPSPEEPTQGWANAPPLQPNTAYTVCFVTLNAFGSQVGSAVHFTTPAAPPAVDSESVSGLGAAGTLLEARIDPNLQETTYLFEWATSQATLEKNEGAKVDGASPLAAELRELPATAIVGVAQPHTTYYYRVIAENESTLKENRPAVGEIKSYALPVVTTGEAQNLTQATATLEGMVNPEGAETSYYFAYIDQAGYDQALAGDAEEKADPYTEGETTPTLSVGSSTEPQAIPPTPISGLQPGTTYDYALVATNAAGREIGPAQTLTTPAPTLPIVSTEGASSITQNAARITGTVTTNGLQTNYGFEIGTEPGEYGAATGLGSIGGVSTEAVSMTLAELQPGTTYYYRVTATNADGTSHGEPQTFTTPGFPARLSVPVSPPQIAIPATPFPTNVTESATPKSTKPKAKPKPKTGAQKLAMALEQCHRQSKQSRAKCERQAHAKYGTAKKKRK